MRQRPVVNAHPCGQFFDRTRVGADGEGAGAGVAGRGGGGERNGGGGGRGVGNGGGNGGGGGSVVWSGGKHGEWNEGEIGLNQLYFSEVCLGRSTWMCCRLVTSLQPDKAIWKITLWTTGYDSEKAGC